MTVSSSVTDNFVVYKFIFEKIELDCGGMELNQFNSFSSYSINYN